MSHKQTNKKSNRNGTNTHPGGASEVIPLALVDETFAACTVACFGLPFVSPSLGFFVFLDAVAVSLELAIWVGAIKRFALLKSVKVTIKY